MGSIIFSRSSVGVCQGVFYQLNCEFNYFAEKMLWRRIQFFFIIIDCYAHIQGSNEIKEINLLIPTDLFTERFTIIIYSIFKSFPLHLMFCGLNCAGLLSIQPHIY